MVSALLEICRVLQKGRNGDYRRCVKEAIPEFRLIRICKVMIPGSVLGIGGIASDLKNTV